MMKFACVAAVLGSAVILALNARAQESEADQDSGPDFLDLANGAVILSSSGEYDQARWSALSAIDGTTQTGWASVKNAVADNSFIIELPAEARLTDFVIDTRGVDGDGRAARHFELSGSSVSASEGFEPLVSGEAANEARTEFAIDAGKPARWLRLQIKDNWGAADYTEVMELEAYGDMTSTRRSASVSGVYDTNYNLMRLEQHGRAVAGCYDWDHGVLTGDTDGRVIRFEWREDGPQIGTAIMVLTADARHLNGLWYENAQLQGVWEGSLVEDGRKPNCTVASNNSVSDALQAGGAATLYGVHFDLDSAVLRDDSAAVLDALLNALNDHPDWRILIEGHTDAQGSADYNLDLSSRRAAAVKAWLVDHGVDAARIETRGKGESEPAADNDTPQGRALNRRVVIRVIQ